MTALTARLLLIVVALGSTLAACTLGGADPAPPPPATTPPEVTAGFTFQWAIGEPDGIAPPVANGPDGLAVVDAVFDSLTALDDAGRPVPAAAGMWESNAQATTWTFTLVDGATFHDGSPVSPQAFMSAWNRQATSGGLRHLLRDVVGYPAVERGALQVLSGVRQLDSLTLQVSLTRPRADFAVLVSHPALGPIVPQQAADAPTEFTDQPLGNGPFRLVEPWAHGDFIRLERYEGWYGGPPRDDGISEVLFRIGDIDEGFLGFRQGRRDVAAVPPEAFELALEEFPPGGQPGMVVIDMPASYLLVLDQDVPPLDELEVRQAIQLMVDRPEIAAIGSLGRLEPSRSLLPRGGWPESADMCTRCTFNPSGAAERLAAAGVTQLRLAFNAGGSHELVRDVLRADLSDIGVGLVSNGRRAAPPFPDYLQTLAAGDTPMFRLTLSADVPSAYELLNPLFHSRQTPAAGGLNYTGYDSPRVDALLEQAAITLDAAARDALMRRVEEIVVNRDNVVVPVVSYQRAVVVGDRTDPFTITPFEGLPLESITAS